MQLTHIPPSEKLAPYVRSYFFTRVNSDRPILKSKLFPTGTHHITFFLEGDVTIFVGKSSFPCKVANIGGQVMQFFEFKMSSNAVFTGIAFKPTAVFKLFGINMLQLKNRFEPLTNYIKDNTYFEKVKNAGQNEGIARVYEEFLLKQTCNLHYLPPIVDQCVEDIFACTGTDSIDNLVKKYNCSRRYLEKHFSYSVGTSPGKYSRLVRFLKVMQRIEADQARSKEILIELNYFDLSHFIKDFEYFMGEKPQSYYNSNHPLLQVLMRYGSFSQDFKK